MITVHTLSCPNQTKAMKNHNNCNRNQIKKKRKMTLCMHIAKCHFSNVQPSVTTRIAYYAEHAIYSDMFESKANETQQNTMENDILHAPLKTPFFKYLLFHNVSDSMITVVTLSRPDQLKTILVHHCTAQKNRLSFLKIAMSSFFCKLP